MQTKKNKQREKGISETEVVFWAECFLHFVYTLVKIGCKYSVKIFHIVFDLRIKLRKFFTNTDKYVQKFSPVLQNR